MKKQNFNLALKRAIKSLKIEAEAAVFLLSSRELWHIKKSFIGKEPKKVVDVLSFPEPRGFPHPGSEKKFLGEIYINKEIVGCNRKIGNSLLVHGLLHLLGYTHKKKGDTMKMQKKETELLSKIM